MRKYLAALPLLLIGFTSCDVHQFPGPKNPNEPETPVLPEETMTIPLELVYHPDFYVWNHEYNPISGKIVESNPDADVYPEHIGTTSKYDNTQLNGILDIHVKAYANVSGLSWVKEESFSVELTGDRYDTTYSIDLPIDTEYTLAVWSHLREDIANDAFYDPSNFNKVEIIGDNYRGNTNYRDGFSAKIKVDTKSEKTQPYKLDMTRPMGKFELVTIDLSEFLDRETTRRGLGTRASADEYYVYISFPYYFPSSYSVLEDRLENSASGVSFKTFMVVTGDSEASLGFEYVMLNNIDDTGAQVRVDIYDPSYTHVAGSTTLMIPMKRDRHTILRGAFLSEDNQGGVGLDPGFSGDHNVIQ